MGHRSRVLGRGYRARIRELVTLGMSKAEILAAIPGLKPSELALTLSISSRRGRPPKKPTIESVDAVKRWRATQRPRTLRAALECIDFLLGRLSELEQRDNTPEPPKRGRTLPGFT